MSAPPRLFISYSWTTPEHQQWVLTLATELRENGVDVVLDKWDLAVGHDSIAFMEKMVSDKTITKVVMICDKAYAEKTNNRAGGVGTEAQIISPELYSKQEQNKFAAVIAETDENGKPFLPTYYKSRIFVDLSQPHRYGEEFEKLLRWIYGKPVDVRPEIGKPPSFVTDPDTPNMGTSALGKRATESFKGNKGYTKGALDEYLTTFSQNLEKFRIKISTGEFEEVVKSIEDFLPARNDFIQVLNSIVQYSDLQDHLPRIHRFFESLIPYMFHPEGVHQWNELDFDNYRFIVHELFLYSIALFLRSENFDAALYMFEQPYYVANNAREGQDPTVSFTVFRRYAESFTFRNQRLNLNRMSLRADLLEQRSKISGIPFQYVMQADFVCFMRAELLGDRWWPETLLYTERYYGPFEIFARSKSAKYFAKVLPLLGISDLSQLKAKLDEYDAGAARVPKWDFTSVQPKSLLGFDYLRTGP